MTVPSFAELVRTAPLHADPAAIERAWEKWRSLPSADGIADADSPDGHAFLRSLLEGVFSGSPYLTNLVMREHDLVRALTVRGPDELLAEIMEMCPKAPPPDAPGRSPAADLRRAKRRAALLIGLADLGGVCDLDWVTRSLSDFAARCLDTAFGHLVAQSAAKGEMTVADPEAPMAGSGIAVLAMGKMGAFEVNYSSDIDLIVIYDADKVPYEGRRSLGDHVSRLTRAMMQLMQERTGDGYVFRTDLRLRPDPSVSPLAVSTEGAFTYYETLAQNWERAAMIKARAAAGDIALGEAFLDEIQPFIWRRSLDFAAIADIQSIKRQIHASKGHGRIAVAGHDIKVGRGGIREIEFFAQTQQLIAGGRDPRLREPRTLDAIDALVETERVEPETGEELKTAYVFLRQIEHRLQMTDDVQTQKLPTDGAALERLAHFSGFETTDAFAEALTGHMQKVAAHYADLFSEEPSLALDQGNLVFTGTDDDPGTVETLAGLGFESPSSVISTVKSWHSGRHRALRTTRARQLLTDLVPAILTALSETGNPNAALINFDRFLGRLPSGIQFMSLLNANQELLKLLARIMGTAPALADALSRNVSLLDTLLEPGETPADDPDDIREQCERELSKEEDYEGYLDAVRRFANDRRFDVGIGLLTRALDFDRVGAALTTTAETSIRALLPLVQNEVARRHGIVPESGMAVIAMGKLGARELTFGSDLDLIFVYDDAVEAKSSDGPSPLQTGPYFTRLSQRFISALTSLTAEGQLYEVDMRLRPSGNKGAVAVPLSAYANYMQKDAWTWEIMAATRARVIAGPEGLCRRVEAAIADAVCMNRDEEELRKAVLDMRARIDQQHRTGDIWKLKHVRGGLVDIEFLIQFLILCNACHQPEIVMGHVSRALEALKEASILDEADATRLTDAYRHLKGAQSLLRLCHSHRFDEEAASADFRRLAAETLNHDSFEDVRQAVIDAEADVLGCFEQLVGRTGDADGGK
ncbi:MAG: bifunctional [glutamine synthetase] adenylyltransferase/[glutamine synthetase]-adenylyl-L-tyrosine phosphorylase [Minwuia sp.]|uniref:bifunctional [glutamine synthetase] adenylyltransferase/[glutamine synthetase]-adenylyl-L-tyrosine phosphorylase n=1 Tax=Minwuia sp. TaxID=2493630 RepID=UPI003A87F990